MYKDISNVADLRRCEPMCSDTLPHVKCNWVWHKHDYFFST